MLPFLILLTFLLPLTAMPAAGQQNAVASLDPVQGLVQYRPGNAAENDWRTLYRVQLIQSSDWIRTDSLGLAYLTSSEGIEVEILPNSIVQLVQFEFTSANSPLLILVLSVGEMHIKIGQVFAYQWTYIFPIKCAEATSKSRNSQ